MSHPIDAIAQHCARRSQLRQWLASSEFAALDAHFEQKHVAWLAQPGETYGYAWALEQIFDPVLASTQTLAQLQAWCEACPGSYHAHLLYGNAWEDAAQRIRSTDCADHVSEAQWAGAQMARDIGLVAYLKAIALHPRPAMALRRVMRLCAYLGEPQWLVDLARGEAPTSYEAWRESWEAPVWEAGLRLLQDNGGTLPEIPAALPPSLPAREPGEFEDAKTYWLRLTLAARPDNLGVLSDYLYYLYPRWGGSHEQMAAFIEGPLCATLSAPQRDALRFDKELDYLGLPAARPDPSNGEEVQAYAQAFERCLELDLMPETRVYGLYLFADYLTDLARSVVDGEVRWDGARVQLAYALLAQAWTIAPPDLDMTGDRHPRMLDTLGTCLWFCGTPDTHALLPQTLARSVRWGDDPQGPLLAAVGSHFGLFGIAAGSFDAPALLDQALQRLAASKTGLNITQLGLNLWEYVSHEAGLYLWEECAARGNSDGMMGLYELYGGRPTGAEDRADLAMARHWQQRAAEAGHPYARNNLADARMQEDAPLSPEEYRTFKQWLSEIWETEERGSRLESAAAANLAWLLLMCGDDAGDKRHCVDHVLRWLWH